MRIRGLVLCGLSLLSAASSAAADWPRFRGPNGSGYAPDAKTPAAFGAADYNWKAALPGVGHSSPVVVGGKVFVTCAEPKDARRSIVCLDLATGKQLWKRDYDSRPFKQHNDNSYASATPAADEKHVYFSFVVPESYKVYALDHAGNDVWSYEVGRWESQHGAGASPIVVDDVVVVTNDQDGPTASLVGLDKATGSERWKVKRKSGQAAASTPCVFRPAGGGDAQVIVTSTADGIGAFDAKTGRAVWSVADAMKFRCIGSPIATESLVVATSGQGAANRSGVVLEPGAPAPKQLYKLPGGKDAPYVPGPVIKGDLMFTWSDYGTVTCLKAATGDKVWQEKVKGEFYSSPIVAGDKLYNVTKTGDVICLRAGETFEQLGRSATGEKCHSSPAVAGNALLIRTVSTLISVGK